MIDWSKPVRTKEGKCRVTIFTTTARGPCPVKGMIHYPEEDVSQGWTLEAHNLENVPETGEVWVNVYRIDKGLLTVGAIYETKEKAAASADVATNVGRMKIVLEKGRWDE